MRTVIFLAIAVGAWAQQQPANPAAEIQRRQLELSAARLSQSLNLTRQIVELEKKLAVLQTEYSQKGRQFTETHPVMLNLKLQIDDLQRQLKELKAKQAEAATPNSAIATVNAKIASQEALVERHAKLVKDGVMPPVNLAADRARLEELRRNLENLKRDAAKKEAEVRRAAESREAAAQAMEEGSKYAKDAFVKSLLQQLDDAKKKYAPAHPRVQELQRLVDTMRAWQPVITPSLLANMAELPEQWWKDPPTIQYLGLTSDQQKQIESVFQQNRAKLIERNAALAKNEIDLDAMVGIGSKDDKQILAGIDRVAEARAELEKLRGRMLLGMRNQLTPEQWLKLSK